MPYVYRHIRLDTNMPFYIGIGFEDTNNFKRAYERKKRRGQFWNRITEKHGYNVDILFENVTKEFAKEKEREFIKLYGRIDLGTGTLCNLTDGGDGIHGWKANEETLKKMSIAAKKRGTFMLQTREVIEKRTLSIRGQKRTEESKKKLSMWQKGVPKPKELIEKMKATKLLPENVEKSRNQTNCKKVMCLNNGIIYRSCAEAARQLGMSHSGVSQVCVGKRKSIKGYFFTYKF